MDDEQPSRLSRLERTLLVFAAWTPVVVACAVTWGPKGAWFSLLVPVLAVAFTLP